MISQRYIKNDYKNKIAKEKEQLELKKLIEFHKSNAEESEAKQTEKENKERGYRRDVFGFEEISKLGTDANIKGFHITNSIKHYFTDEPTPNIKISDPRPKNKQHHPPDLKWEIYKRIIGSVGIRTSGHLTGQNFQKP
ncbi:hypothetical protein BpHYR1_013359 [Brachionus plicatilis]|uniref:Uncharacterized protein n=1 Tax=Brachionus plicatilis TaxID=10195 RepID=A0A3M7QU05_BRAPC|nr:hypothetical protein BpHYR1_013359 [Brachionus plicatilis]